MKTNGDEKETHLAETTATYALGVFCQLVNPYISGVDHHKKGFMKDFFDAVLEDDGLRNPLPQHHRNRKPGKTTITTGVWSGINDTDLTCFYNGRKKIPAWKAIAKCLLQGIRYTLAWTGLWWVLAALLLLPVFLRILQKKNGAFFSHPILFTGYAYGLFCSMSCPLFYTMNSTGPGRAVAIVYYMFLLISFTVFFYWIGFVLLKMQARPNPPKRIEVSGKLNTARYLAMAVLLFSILCTGLWQETSAMKAIRVLTDGEAAAYAAEYEDRLLLLNDPEVTDVILTPFTHQPALIYTSDLPGDPEDPTSRKVAQYFQKTSLYVNYGNN